LPSSQQLTTIWGSPCSAGDAAASCRGGDDVWDLPQDLLYAVLRRTNKVPCYAGWSPNAGRKPELDGSFANPEAFVSNCERILDSNGDAPVSCFWVNEKVRAAWLKHLWFYRVPHIYYWDYPEDLSRKLERWTWQDTLDHRARLNDSLNKTLVSAQSELVSRLKLVSQDLEEAVCSREKEGNPRSDRSTKRDMDWETLAVKEAMTATPAPVATPASP